MYPTLSDFVKDIQCFIQKVKNYGITNGYSLVKKGEKRLLYK